MRGIGAYHLAQTKHCDARIFELCGHLRLAIDILSRSRACRFERKLFRRQCRLRHHRQPRRQRQLLSKS